MRKLRSYLLIAGVMTTTFACNSGHKDNKEDMQSEDVESNTSEQITMADAEVMEKVATFDIAAKSGSSLTGSGTFTQTEDGKVMFEIKVQNATPGKHAVHIHEKGDCSAADGKSAGGHWNPTGVEHGKRGTGTFHKGDIGNMEVDKDGTGTYTVTADDWSVGGDEDSNVVGHAIIIHDGADDFTSQPSGNAGNRVGCGVIKLKS